MTTAAVAGEEDFAPPVPNGAPWQARAMAYVGNLTCRDCGVTFTARWGSFADADEYRCTNDHVVYVAPGDGRLMQADEPTTLADLRGLWPFCDAELASGLLPRCPVCSSRDHEVSVAGLLS